MTVATVLLLAVSAVQVEAEVCPSARDIEAALATTLAVPAGAARPGVVRVLRQGHRLLVELLDGNGMLVGERALDDSDRCAELAAEVAVVVASWLSDVHPEFSPSGPEPPLAAAGAAKRDPGPPPEPGTRASFDVAAGISWSYAGSAAVGGSLAATWIPRRSGLGLRLSAGTETARALELGEGRQAIWRRWTATTEGDWRAGRGPLVLDVHAGLAWTLLTASGAGFPQETSFSSPASGVTAGARLSWWTTRRVAWWLGGETAYWLRRQLVAAAPAAPERQIPRWSVMATLGLALGRAPILPLGSVGLAAQ